VDVDFINISIDEIAEKKETEKNRRIGEGDRIH